MKKLSSASKGVAGGRVRYTAAVVTGSRSEFGLLDPVIAELARQARWRVQVIVAGEHLAGERPTKAEVAAKYAIAAEVAMHARAAGGLIDRKAYATCVGRGVERFAEAFTRLSPDVVVVLGDRVEAFAGAIAGNLLGLRVCHIHAGDVAEGIADEAMRHAISRLAHAHACATKQAAQRVLASGEAQKFVKVTGSPAIDAIAGMDVLDEGTYASLGSPKAVVLVHPSGMDEASERRVAGSILEAARRACGQRVLCLQPNLDPGREVIASAIKEAAEKYGWQYWPHLPRREFVGLLKKLAQRGVDGALVGNSSAGIIEAGAIGLRVINVGPRQAGRERGGHVIDVALQSQEKMTRAIERGLREGKVKKKTGAMLFGDGRASEKIVKLIGQLAAAPATVIRKRLTI